MFTLTLDDETAARLQAFAQQQNRSPNEVLRDLIGRLDTPQPTDNTNWALKMAQMAEADTRIKWNAIASNLAENSREILNSEFADYLLKHDNKDE